MKTQKRKSRSFGIETLEGRTLLSVAAQTYTYPGQPTASTETASASIVATQLTSTTYKYSVTVTDTAAATATTANQVGTFWYAWVPGADYLDTAPLSVSSPAGWTDQIVHGGSTDGYSIQWVAGSNAIQAGKSLSGFTFTSSNSPTQVFGKSNFYPTTNINTAFVYAAGPETDAGFNLTPTTSITPATPVTPVTSVARETASATVVASQLTPTTYQYSITLKNTSKGRAAAANQIGTFWYAWLPGEDFLDTAPLTVTSPAGWTDKITNSGASDGFAIQWVNTTSPLKAGRSLSGFVFTSTDTPGQVFGKSSFYPTPPVNTSDVYSGAPFSDAGFVLDAVGSILNPRGDLLPELQVSSLVTGSTVPANGDVNPYGVTFVPKGFATGGSLAAGDVLVSNFNNSDNLQGTGSTIVSVNPAGATSTFYQGPAGVGLTTALGVLRSGFVLVGNVPSTDGTSATVGQGSLIVLDRFGNQVADFTDPNLLDGPWDLAVVDSGASATVFVSNVLGGTVSRLSLKLSTKKDTVTLVRDTQIASGFTTAPNAAALVVGPTGLVYDAARTELFVASTGDNAIYGITRAINRTTDVGTGTLIYQDAAHLRGPLALVMAPNGDLIAANGDAINADSTQPSELVEFTIKGQFVAQTPVDSSGEGGAFGIAISAPIGNTVEFAAVDDLTNSLDIWTIKRKLL
jgi:hypothetical protein